MGKMCRKGTFDIGRHKGGCPQNCVYGAWNKADGICGAECLECGGTLYLDINGAAVCDGCGKTS